MLLAMDAAGVPRPGQTRPQRPPSKPAPARNTAGKLPVEVQAAEPVQPAVARRAGTDAPARPIAELLAELDALVGLRRVKDEVAPAHRASCRCKRCGLNGACRPSRPAIISCSPATPAPARRPSPGCSSQIYRSVGVVSKGHLVETDRALLVAGFVGQTATKTLAVLDSALGGMLLIDEAYSLARGGDDDFGREAIDTLVKFMEDNRDDIGVVAAGYPEEMSEFIDDQSRAREPLHRTIALRRLHRRRAGDDLHPARREARLRSERRRGRAVATLLVAEPRGRGFGNARFVRNVFEDAVEPSGATPLRPAGPQ